MASICPDDPESKYDEARVLVNEAETDEVAGEFRNDDAYGPHAATAM